MNILVTGGAGYIGSHVLLELEKSGHDVVVYDNLSTGHAWAVQYGELVVGDLADGEKLNRLFSEHSFDAVIHFAASISVSESVADPLKYYSNNTCNTLALLEMCQRYRLKQFVFSSTAAVYGEPKALPVSESAEPAPCNPYGASKMMSERMIEDVAAASDMKYVILRYFNAAGADPEGRVGQATPGATHLIKVACEAAAGKREAVAIFGTDYPTADGTCIRDYVHVSDLARAHTLALEYLAAGGVSIVLNCGYGRGSSVRQVIETVKSESGVNFPVREGARRIGDSSEIVADGSRIRAVLGWQPRFDDLSTIVATAWQWEKKAVTGDELEVPNL